MGEDLGLDDLHHLSEDPIRGAIIDAFLSLVKSSPSVSSVFFNGYKIDLKIDSLSCNYEFIDDVACGLVCSAISRIQDHDFNRTVDQYRADSYWRQRLDSNEGKILGTSLFWWGYPDHCRSEKHTLRDYINSDKNRWGREYADRIMSPEYINGELQKLIAGEPNWPRKIQMIFRKLWFLDASMYGPVLNALYKAYPEITKLIVLPLDNFLASDNFRSEQFLDPVGKAANVGTPYTIMLPRGGFRTFYEYGEDVVKFLKQKPKNFQLYTGKKPKGD
jgi:hypothetical protein